MGSEQDFQGNLPTENRETIVKEIKESLYEEPSTVALLLYPTDFSDQTGVFAPLKDTYLIPIEIDGGVRDGHKFWRRGHNWDLHLRWISVSSAFWGLQNPDSFSDDIDIDFLTILNDGDVLFDKDDIVSSLLEISSVTSVYQDVPFWKRQKYRITLQELIDRLYEIETSTTSPDDAAVKQLLSVYQTITEIVFDIEQFEEDLNELSPQLGIAGKDRHSFTSFTRELRTLSGTIMESLGGSPPSKWYSPAYKPHLSPFASMIGDDTESSSVEQCSDCSLKFRTD